MHAVSLEMRRFHFTHRQITVHQWVAFSERGTQREVSSMYYYEAARLLDLRSAARSPFAADCSK